MNIPPSLLLFFVLWFKNIHILYADVETVSSSSSNSSNQSTSSNTTDINDALLEGEGREQQQDQYEDLEAMTNEELEEICTSRGFEVVKETDAETGEAKVYSHEDYVHAAKQCLDIEAEMQEILSKHPELVQEIEAEAERMRLENERLQSKIKDMIHENIETDHAGDQQDDANITTTTMVVEDEVDDDTKLSVGGGGDGSNTLIVDDDSDEILDLDHNITYQNNNRLEQPETTDKDEGEKEESPSRDVMSPVSASPQEILTFGDITREVKAQMLQDLQRVANILLPKKVRLYLIEASKPMVAIAREATKTVYGMVKRYALHMWQGVPQGHNNGGGGGGGGDGNSTSTGSQDDHARKVNSTS